MGKRLKFPKRGKYIPPVKKAENSETGTRENPEKSIDEEEHKKRVEMLKQLGLLK